MPISRTFMNGIRAGLVAVALGGTALVGAAPAQAAVGIGFNFGLPGPGNGVTIRFGMPNYFKYCATNNQILRQLRNNGYKNAQIVRETNSTNKVWAVGRKGGNWYQLRVDRCTGRVDKIRVVNGPDKRGHFSLSFSF